MTDTRIVIATRHQRGDRIEAGIRLRLPDVTVVRIRERGELSVERLAALSPRYVFIPHWSWIIPNGVHARFECVVFHMTDLPYGRGGSPLQNLILRGHSDTVITAFRCVDELDAGPVYMKSPLSLGGSAEEILTRAGSVIEDMIVEIVRKHPLPVPQEGEPLMFKRRKPSDGSLQSASQIREAYDYIRMLDGEGYPPAFLETEHLRFDFTDAASSGDEVEAKVRITRRTADG